MLDLDGSLSKADMLYPKHKRILTILHFLSKTTAAEFAKHVLASRVNRDDQYAK